MGVVPVVAVWTLSKMGTVVWWWVPVFHYGWLCAPIVTEYVEGLPWTKSKSTTTIIQPHSPKKKSKIEHARSNSKNDNNNSNNNSKHDDAIDTTYCSFLGRNHCSGSAQSFVPLLFFFDRQCDCEYHKQAVQGDQPQSQSQLHKQPTPPRPTTTAHYETKTSSGHVMSKHCIGSPQHSRRVSFHYFGIGSKESDRDRDRDIVVFVCQSVDERGGKRERSTVIMEMNGKQGAWKICFGGSVDDDDE